MNHKLLPLLGAFAAVAAVSATAAQPAKTHANGHAPLVRKLSTAGPRQSLTPPTTKVPVNAQANFSHKAAFAPAAPTQTYATSTSDVPSLYGSVVYATGWDGLNSPVGLYTVPSSSAQTFNMKIEDLDATGGGVLSDGIYYCCRSTTFMDMTMAYYYAYDFASGEMLWERMNYVATAMMTLDPTTGTVYAISPDMNGLNLITVGFDAPAGEQLSTKYIASLPGKWNSLAAGKDGQLYGIRYYTEMQGEYEICTGSELYRIDKQTGAVALVGNTGMKPQFASSATIDPLSGRMFWTVSPMAQKGMLTEVNLSTGVATPIYTFPDDQMVVGLVADVPAAYPKAPAAAAGLKAEFNGASLSGKLSFTAPSTLFDGTSARGAVTAIVKVNGVATATREVQYGSNVTFDLTVPAAGAYDFAVVMSNAAGESPRVTLGGVYVGADTPKAPEVTLTTTDDLTMNLSWKPVTESANGGYINPSEIVYTVRRLPADVVVAERTKATSFSERLPEPDGLTMVSYTVTAEYAGMISAPGHSASVTLGAVTPPYSNDFSSGLNGFSVVDANADGTTWYADDFYFYARVYSPTSNDMDDWLMTPPLSLKAGNAYKLSFDAITTSQFDETLEVKMGLGTAVADLTTTLVEPVTFLATIGSPRHITVDVIPTADGVYTIGFHGISPAQHFYLAIDNVEISAPTSAHVPCAVSDLTVTPAAMGALNATIAFTAPTMAIDNTPVGSLARIEVSRDGRVVKTFERPAAGQALSFTDNVDKEGNYTYKVVASTDNGPGASAEASAYVGTGIASAPEGVKLTHDLSHPGQVTISWNPVTTNEHGNSIDPANVKYNLYIFDYVNPTPVAQQIASTSYTFQAVAEGRQEFVQYAVYPVTAAGEGSGALTEQKAVGTPYDGLTETGFSGNIWGVDGSNASWFTTVDEVVGVMSQDGDNAMLAIAGAEIDSYATLSSGLISLKDMKQPAIWFYTFPLGSDDENSLTVIVTDAATGESAEIISFAENTLPEMEAWNKVMVDLGRWKGQTVTVEFRGMLKSYSFLLIDNIKVAEQPDVDMSVAALDAPTRAATGEKFTVRVTVANESLKPSPAFSVSLYDGATLLSSWNGSALTGNTKQVHTFEAEMETLATEPMKLSARVEAQGDQNPDNNVSPTATVHPEASSLPAPVALTATGTDNGITLNWTAPDLSRGAAMRMTEDFETAESWAHSYGDWMFVDLDQAEVGGIMGVTTPGIDYSITKASFYVLDSSHENMDQTFATHSGDKMLAALYRWDNQTVDDWAISPLLDGRAQTIHFYARSYSSDYPETFEILYTTTDGGRFNKRDYTLCNRFEAIPGHFTEFSADLPEGATHFAIRNCGTGAYIFFVDDVTFIPDANRRDVTLKGYDLYRNGKKLNARPLTATSFTDSDVELGQTYSYKAVALYDLGSSAPAAVEVSYSSVGGIEADSKAVVTSDGAGILVEGAAGAEVAVYSIDGLTLYSGVAQTDRLSVSVAPGVYLVRVGSAVVKIRV